MSAHKHLTVVPTGYRKSTDEVKAIIGNEYLDAEVSETESQAVRRAVDLLNSVNRGLFEKIPVQVWFTEEDPYSSYEEMRRDIEENERLLIFSGGTTPPYNDHDSNLKTRAVHDYWGHYHYDVDFSFWGEFTKWASMREVYPAATHRLTFTEVVGQLSAASQLEGGFGDPAFSQKAILAPDRWINLCFNNRPRTATVGHRASE